MVEGTAPQRNYREKARTAQGSIWSPKVLNRANIWAEIEGEREISLLIACPYQSKSEAGDLMYPSNIDPQHLTKIDCGLTALIEPDTPNGVSFKHELRMTAGQTAGTVTGSQKFWRENKEKRDHVHLEVRFKHGKSLLLSYSQPLFTVDAYCCIGSHIIISKWSTKWWTSDFVCKHIYTQDDALSMKNTKA